MWWVISLVLLQFSASYAQLTSPDEPVCVGKQVVFSCRQAGFSRWTINLPPGEQLSSPLISSTVSNMELMFDNDPGFGFTVHILSTSQGLHSELHVTAVSELNGATVRCTGGIQTMSSTIQISNNGSPAAPSGVMTTVDESQFTRSTASITLTWSASSGADNYTIMVTPPLSTGESLVSTTATSLQLTMLYNVQYSINITALDCVCGGSNSTTVILPTAIGCSPPYPPANGRISEHNSGAVGAMLTFQCDTGYKPQAATSTCMPNTSWVPIPMCNVSQCGPPTAPVNGHINDNHSNTVDGSQITFHCGGDSPVMTSTYTNGHWIPDPDELHCAATSSDSGNVLSAASQVLITATVCSLIFFILGLLVGVLFHYWATVRGVCRLKQSSNNSPTPPVASVPVVYEEVPSVSDSCTEKKSDIELRDNLAYVPVGCS